MFLLTKPRSFTNMRDSFPKASTSTTWKISEITYSPLCLSHTVNHPPSSRAFICNATQARSAIDSTVNAHTATMVPNRRGNCASLISAFPVSTLNFPPWWHLLHHPHFSPGSLRAPSVSRAFPHRIGTLTFPVPLPPTSFLHLPPDVLPLLQADVSIFISPPPLTNAALEYIILVPQRRRVLALLRCNITHL
jgi:hypothetical protein